MPDYCVSCSAPIPSNQGSRLCSYCYGDADHGKDGYLRREIERREQEQEREPHDHR
jgi:hypothetical protein